MEFNIFNKVVCVEWDILLFFFGVIFCVGGLGILGYLLEVFWIMYVGWGVIMANIVVGVLFVVVDNILVMFVVLIMNLDMNLN